MLAGICGRKVSFMRRIFHTWAESLSLAAPRRLDIRIDGESCIKYLDFRVLSIHVLGIHVMTLDNLSGLPGSNLDTAKMPGHWLLSRLGKQVHLQSKD